MKIRSLLLGSVAAAGLSTGAYAVDLGVMTSLDALDAFESPAIVVTDVALNEFGPVFGDKWLDDVIITAGVLTPETYPDGDGFLEDGLLGVDVFETFSIVKKIRDTDDSLGTAALKFEMFEVLSIPDAPEPQIIETAAADIHYPQIDFGLHWSMTGPGAVPPDPANAGTCRVQFDPEDCMRLAVGANG